MVTALVPVTARAIVAMGSWRAAKTIVTRSTMAGGISVGGSLWQRALSFAGGALAFDFLFDLFGFDLGDLFGNDDSQIDDMVEEIENMIRSGAINVAAPRRGDDPGAMPSIFVYDMAGNLNGGKPFLTWEYFSRNFVKSVRSRERTRNFRGRNGFRQARRVRS